MYKNYYFLNRLALELNQILKNYTVTEAYSQEKDKLVLQLNNGGSLLFLELSTNSVNPFILLHNKISRAKKNTIDFFGDILPIKLKEILIAENERIILFWGESKSIYYFIRGNNSNIFAETDDNSIFTFRNCEEETKQQIIKDIHKAVFANTFYKPELDDIPVDNFEPQLKEKFSTISKDILREAKFRTSGDEPGKLKTEILTVLSEIENRKPVVFYNEQTQEMLLAVDTFRSFPYTGIKEFQTLNDALFYHIGKKYFLETVILRKRSIDKYFKRELPKLTAKLENLKNRLDTPSREEEYKNTANLLLININKLLKGQNSITLEDIYNDCNEVTIKLDESLSPKNNIDHYFKKSKSERINIEKSKKLYDSLTKVFNRLKEYEAKFLSTNKPEDYEQIMKELKIEINTNKAEKSAEEKFNFKQYIIDKKYNVYVGKDSANNDLLTTKFAKQNDYWFHARSVPGSHVVLRVENTKEAVPKSVLKAAAALAAFHSKAKTASTAPVTYTLKKNVYKKKGMNAGQVALTKEEVLLVKPEIPSNCEFISGE
jgi:Predicted RNA-binding protein homologous to eukaryotic snRNP